jgi:hypothetical protein
MLADRVGARPNANERTVMRWTLAIPPDYKLAWREEETQVELGAP